ncbi:MAG TPA: hypothetical protein VJ697_12315 [Nitrososphaeraceae archaeon]|nr:hypothetical protein [Nitrososphaeraceae archaeon]
MVLFPGHRIEVFYIIRLNSTVIVSVSNDPIGITIPFSKARFKAANCIAFRVCIKHFSDGSIGDVGGMCW